MGGNPNFLIRKVQLAVLPTSIIKPNTLVVVFRLRVFFYKALEIFKEVIPFSYRIGFRYLYIVIKEYNVVSALVIAYNRKEIGILV